MFGARFKSLSRRISSFFAKEVIVINKFLQDESFQQVTMSRTGYSLGQRFYGIVLLQVTRILDRKKYINKKNQSNYVWFPCLTFTLLQFSYISHIHFSLYCHFVFSFIFARTIINESESEVLLIDLLDNRH